MANSIGPRTSSALREQLDRHPIYAEVRDLGDLRLFMAHHVYAVWDFMSLVKYVQGHIAPVSVPWMPTAHPSMLRQFINAMVLAEESDEGLADATGQPTAVAHFDLYCQAMREVGADTGVLMRFLEQVGTDGVRSALGAAAIPGPARRFMAATFGFIDTGKAHVVAAALAVGREQVIPGMFRALLRDLGVVEAQAPAFYHYLKRHIHLDDDTHGPMAMRLLEEVCAGDAQKVLESEQAAHRALEARIHFWDEVRAVLRAGRSVSVASQPRLGAVSA